MKLSRSAAVALTAVGATLAGCGGGGGGSSSSAHTASAKQVATCAAAAGFKVTTEKFDPSTDETAQLGLNTPATVTPLNSMTITFFSNGSAASAYYQAEGGAKNPGAEPGGNDQIGTVVVGYYAKDAWLTRAERCIRG
jgi:hypothetical protein